MMQMPNETWDEYKARYREAYLPLRHLIKMGTVANHLLGDISRDDPDYFMLDRDADQSGDDFIGFWITGFGFFNVHFPKSTSRLVTDDEWEWFLDNPVVMA